MSNTKFKKAYIVIITISIVLLTSCTKMDHREPGYLKGIISIGPICPVERIPPDPACLPTAETYKAYPVDIFSSSGKTKILQLSPSPDGSFVATLPSGDYMVILDRAQNTIGGSNLPVQISITSNNTTTLNVSIDTGIR
jgi:hypothetical protein